MSKSFTDIIFIVVFPYEVLLVIQFFVFLLLFFCAFSLNFRVSVVSKKSSNSLWLGIT
jgi:hypothetical protein